MKRKEYKKWICVVCGLVYDEEIGLPDDGIIPGTLFENINDDWLCVDCGVRKKDFMLLDF